MTVYPYSVSRVFISEEKFFLHNCLDTEKKSLFVINERGHISPYIHLKKGWMFLWNSHLSANFTVQDDLLEDFCTFIDVQSLYFISDILLLVV